MERKNDPRCNFSKISRYIDNYKIEVIFDDGKKGIVDFSKYLKMGGIFERFKNNDI